VRFERFSSIVFVRFVFFVVSISYLEARSRGLELLAESSGARYWSLFGRPAQGEFEEARNRSGEQNGSEEGFRSPMGVLSS
jgi:hypothetical protein